jgi:23S rRNA (cytosine1962-C5)-methyltransferase
MNSQIEGYSLLDSGDGRKLERFGDVVVDRPSSLSAWRRRNDAIWESADAVYSPPDRWETERASFSSWKASVAGVELELELMSNGQLGIFPEHALYLPRIGSALEQFRSRSSKPVRVLNLFAYTGLATAFCAKHGDVLVTHVDLAKRAIDWAKRNVQLNTSASDRVRWIVDDALAFMAREARKSNVYDIIIIDPPSFSRVSKNASWTLEEKTPDIVNLVLDVLAPEAGVVFFTNHSAASTSDVARNIALDRFSDQGVQIAIEPLSLKEERTERTMPAGSLITLSHTS